MGGEYVSIFTVISILFTAILSFLLPIGFLIYWRRKHHAKLKVFFIGVLSFLVAVVVLESLFNSIIIQLFGEAIHGNNLVYSIYGGLIAGIFEETVRLIVMRFIIRKEMNKESAITYGIGHGGAESIILIGITYIVNLFIVLLINTGNLNLILNSVPEAYYGQVYAQLSPLWTEKYYLFLIAGIERIFAFFL